VPMNSCSWIPLPLKNDVKSVQSQFEETSGTHLGQLHGLVLPALCDHRGRHRAWLVDTAAVGNEISSLASTLFLHRYRNRILFLVEVDATRQVGNSSKTT